MTSGTRPRSLVQQLSRSLILAVMLVWLASTAWVAWYVNHQIQQNFDVELVESAHRQLYPAVLDLQQRGLPTQAQTAMEPLLLGTAPLASDPHPLLLQLRNAQGEVLLRTAAAPAAPFAAPLQEGFYDTPEFRVFSLYDSPHAVWLQLADPLDERSQASRHTLMGLVGVLLLILPLLAGLIRWIAQRQLHSLEQLQQQITARNGSNLQALNLQHMPQELQAVGQGVNQLLERLSEALNVERSLAANAAHELRTPLAEIRLRLHTAIDQAHSGPATVPVQAAQLALQSIETLAHRTERLLQLSRAEARDLAHSQPVDLVLLAEQVAQTFWQQALAQKRLDWLPPATPDPVWVQGDMDTLALALRNLIDNALHHTAGAVELEVIAAPQPMLVVRDQGPFLSAAQLTQMQQRHARIGSHHLGYGLGMSIVRTIADKHGAQLLLQSPAPQHPQGLEVQLIFTTWVTHTP